MPGCGPERGEEETVGAQRNAADDVPDGRPEEDGQQQARRREDEVAEGAPQRVVDVRAQLKTNAAQHQQPEHDHQRQVEAAEARRVEQREGEVERPARGEQPDLVAVPDGAD
jgi:hypothetical protein